MAKTSVTKPRGHLTKKELKQDKLVDFAYKAERFYLQNQKLVLGIAVGILIVVLAVVFIRKTTRSSRMEDSYQLMMAKIAYGSGRADEAENAFRKIASSMGGDAAAQAKLYLGKIAYDKENYSQAAQEFQAYLKDNSGNEELDVAAMSGLAASYEALDRLSEAVQLYMEIPDKYLKNAYAPQALLEAARVYRKLNQNDKLINAYHMILDKYPESHAASTAKRELEKLE
jgi:TolA-binding protein